MRALLILMYCLMSLGQGTRLELQKSRPHFDDYPMRHVYRGKPARPIITKAYRSFRTRIRLGADSDVEFAGHYTVPRWGCGTDCNVFVIVDSISGTIYEGLQVEGLPAKWLESHGGEESSGWNFIRIAVC